MVRDFLQSLDRDVGRRFVGGPLLQERFDARTERWSPSAWTAERGYELVNAIDEFRAVEAGGPESRQRAFHRDGRVFVGRFRSTGLAAEWSDAAVFDPDRDSRVIARFSPMFATLPEPDEPVRDVLGMAVRVWPLDHDELTEPSDLVAMTASVFPVKTASQFASLLGALRSRPIWRTVQGLGWMTFTRQTRPSALWAGVRALRTTHEDFHTQYHGVQTFYLVRERAADSSESEATAMRYRWIPLPRSPDHDPSIPGPFLLELTLRDPATSQDDLMDPTREWPRERVVIAGRLELEHGLKEDPPGLGFNPLNLAPGIEPGDDALFPGRRGAYAVSHLRRS